MKESAASLRAAAALLPVAAVRERLLAELRSADTTILVGETGSGKSTQVPPLILDAGLARGRRVAVTQPRRVAAASVATRVAAERGVPLGGDVGYRVRFKDVTTEATRLVYLTDGLLARDALLDPALRRYGAVVLDEAHERTVQTDVLLGLVKAAQRERRRAWDAWEEKKGGARGGGAGGDASTKRPPPPPLRIVVMSATLDAAKFAAYFGGARVLHVAGRQFPVDLLYLRAPAPSYVDAALKAALQIHEEEAPGDVLIFMTGQDEIEALARLLRDRAAGARGPADCPSLTIAPLYAALSPDTQAVAFAPAPPGHRKVVLATNVAETSVTVPGVRFVVDAGLVKARTFAARLGADSLQVVPVSQAQARQRAGRAGERAGRGGQGVGARARGLASHLTPPPPLLLGREAPGKAFRLYTEAAFRGLAPTTAPEVQRVDLSAVVLQLAALGVKHVPSFDFIDPPPTSSLLRAVELLLGLGALAPDGALTPVGRGMARLPVDPPYGRALLAAAATGCGDDCAAVVAMASADAVFADAPADRERAAALRARFASLDGDHVTLLRVFRGFQAAPPRERKRWCADFFLSHRALKRAADIHAQLMGHLDALPRDQGRRSPELASAAEGDSAPLRRALVAGLFAHAAVREPGGRYVVVATGQAVALHPSSVLVGGGKGGDDGEAGGGGAGGGPRGRPSRPPRPACVVFDELLRTSRDYARVVTAVDPAWLPELAPAFFARHRGAAGLGAAVARGEG